MERAPQEAYREKVDLTEYKLPKGAPLDARLEINTLVGHPRRGAVGIWIRDQHK